MPLYNCPASVRVDAMVCSMLREGKALVVKALLKCPRRNKVREAPVEVTSGIIMCSIGHCSMLVESFMCKSEDCGGMVVADGRDLGVVFLSLSTASTALILRDMAWGMTTSGSTFGACYRHWVKKYADLRDSGAYPDMKPSKGRSRHTISNKFFHAVHLMKKDPPIWDFLCPARQDRDGR